MTTVMDSIMQYWGIKGKVHNTTEWTKNDKTLEETMKLEDTILSFDHFKGYKQE